MISHNIIEKIKYMLDPAIRSLLIAAVPLIAVFLLGKMVFPVSKALRVVRFRGLPTSIEQSKSNKPTAKWARHLVLLSRSIKTGDENDEELLQQFILTTIGAFVATYLVYGFWTGLFERGDFHYSNLLDRWLIIISFMAGSLPYCFMRMKLHRVRVKNSYDLVPAVNTLILKYSEYRGNLYYAVFETHKRATRRHSECVRRPIAGSARVCKCKS